MASAAEKTHEKPRKSKLKPKNTKTKKHRKLNKSRKDDDNKGKIVNNDKNDSRGKKTAKDDVVQLATSPEQQLGYFIKQYESSNGLQLSSLELDSLKETCIVELQNKDLNLDEHVKVAFGSSWKEVLCEKDLRLGEVDPGSPALLVISASALRSLEVLREFRSLTKECHAAKLFSKHMKIEEQVSVLKNRVNIASGTPSRIKKLVDIEALGLSRLKVIVLDMHKDVKGYSLFTLPQVREEFWDLYRSYFHQPLLKGDICLCFYCSVPAAN